MGIDFRRPRHIRGFRFGEALIWDFTSKPLVEKTVSGTIAHISDGADRAPIKSWEVEIAPTLTGKSAIECTQTGKNLINANDESKTFSANVITNYDVASLELKKGVTYTFSAYQNTAITGSTRNTLRILFDGNNTYESIASNYHNQAGVHSMSITPTQDGTAVFAIWVHTSNEDITYSQFMVEYGSTATAYEPYTAPTQYTASLGRTIYGGTADVVNGTAEPINWLNNTLTTQTVNGTTFTVNADKSITVSGTPSQQTRVYISQEAITINEAMFFSFGTMPTGTRVFCSRTSGGTTSYPTISPSHTATLDAVYTNFLLEIGTSFDGTAFTIYPLCNNGTSASEYSPYFEPFTFTPITPTPETVGKVNNVYCNTGDTEVTYYDNAHGFSEVTVNKTGKNLWSSGKDLSITRDKTMYMKIPRGTYTLSFDFVSSTASPVPSYMQVSYSTTDGTKYNPVTVVEGRCSRTFTLSADARNLTIYSSTSYSASVGVTTVVNNIQLEVGSQASSYEPYEAVSKTAYLHKVIYGGTADVVKGTCEPKNLFDDSTFPRTATDNTYYAQFQSNLAEGNKYKIPTIHIEPDVAYVLSFDVECNAEPFNASVGIGIGSYSRDIANANNNTSGRISVPFTLTSVLKEQYGDILSFRVPRYSTPREFTFTISNVQLEKASSASEYAPHFEPFSFPPISIGTDEGENTLFATEGDSSITYRKAVD